MEVMYSNQPNNGYFAVKQLVGFYGEIDDLSILIAVSYTHLRAHETD